MLVQEMIGTGLAAIWELERDDVAGPVATFDASILLVVVLLRVPESAIITRVHAHAAVVAPSIAAIHLHRTSGDNNRRRFHLAERIAGHSAGVPDTRVQVGRRISTHAHRDVSPLVHSHARHPQIIGLALERARLVEGEISPRGS